MEIVVHSLWVGFLLGLICAVAQAQKPPLTRAERSNYAETSTYEEVIRFLDDLQKQGAPIRIQPIGVSEGGRPIPLVICAKPLVATPAEARRMNKAIVYVQANIHGGEVEGKEAILMMLRELSRTDKDKLLNEVILLVTPIYNIDGNEKWGPNTRNRPEQDGPEPVGERFNGQGLDLNRDCIKAESPEMRAALKAIYTTWDPDLVIDLHTTNGSRHGYHLTYAPPLNPNTEPGIMRYTRDSLLPGIRRRLQREAGEYLFDYGNVMQKEGQSVWSTFGEEARYVTNYVGLRNRIAVLSEATSYLPFETRVQSTYRFVEAVLKETAKNRSKILQLTREADARVSRWGSSPSSAPALGVRFETQSRGVEPVRLEKLSPGEKTHPRSAPKATHNIEMPVYDRFQATRIARLPIAYLLSTQDTKTVELLRRHGVVVERLKGAWFGLGEAFNIKECNISKTLFQGHRLIRLEGEFKQAAWDMPLGGYLVRTAQPLGMLIFHLLEPESLDGVAAWGFLESSFSIGSSYPILKIFNPVRLPTEQVD